MKIDPAAALRAARTIVSVIPERTVRPPGTQADPRPDPITVPARITIAPDVAELPAAIRTPDGVSFDLTSAFGLVWAMLHSLEIRSVQGSVTVTGDPAFTGGTIWPPGATITRTITWTNRAPAPPTGVLLRAEAGLLGAGRTVAAPVDGTVTDTGCQITATNVSGSAIIANPTNPITYIAQALYLHTPPVEMP